ncbi:uncharacterized protein CTRU02_210727 [Colletotrichum truncatum]|uniref:Uncharacterized protein n=1 Tax=Colletotrichum truncatum TaxID=5467 RepID=A0ACC3YPU5_COLTU
MKLPSSLLKVTALLLCASASVNDQSVTHQYYNRNALIRRTMVLPEGDTPAAMDKFMVSECKKYVARGCPQKELQRGENTASLVTWDNKKDGKSINVAELMGCTALVLVSRKGAFTGHYFESISFDPDADSLSTYGDKDTAFDKSVIELIRNGNSNRNAHPSLAMVKEKIDDPSLRAWLVIPSDGATDEHGNVAPDPYRDAWEKLKTFVTSEFPGLKEPGRWLEVKYAPRQDEEKLYRPKIFDIATEVTKRPREELEKDGQINWSLLNQKEISDITSKAEKLVTYDPIKNGARGKVVVKHHPNTDGKNRVMVWVEYSTLYADAW